MIHFYDDECNQNTQKKTGKTNKLSFFFAKLVLILCGRRKIPKMLFSDELKSVKFYNAMRELLFAS